MDKQTLEQLEAALDAVSRDLAPRVEVLARKSTEGTLTPDEQREYAEVVRLNDMLSTLKLEAEDFGPCGQRRDGHDRGARDSPATGTGGV
jgi:hypothetical protein